jgi:hypothetical protein
MKKCFGELYPDLSRVEVNKDLVGKVFRVRFVSQGMMRQPPQLNADLVEWEECRECVEYESCYDFSNAKLAMHQALRNIP